MTVSLTQTQALSELAERLYSFLPGKPHPFGDQRVSFPGVAASLDLGGFWPGGSKLPAISGLLSRVLRDRPTGFCPLLVGIVRTGIVYRQNKGEPLTRDEMEEINELIARVGFKIPELIDSKFLDGLPSSDNGGRATETTSPSESATQGLKSQLLAMAALSPQDRGYEFEKFLNALFDAYGLDPKGAFRLRGEQIDGSYQFQGDTYLVEATWRSALVGQEELLAFSGKVAGKAQWSRGLMVSYSGFSSGGLDAFGRGKPTNIVCMDGLDLHDALDSRLDLRRVIEEKSRVAAETNQAFVPVRTLFA